MNAHALAVLQFPEALGVVAGYASSHLGAQALAAFQPATSKIVIESELRRVEQMATLLARTEQWALPRIPDARAALRKAAVAGAALDGSELNELVLEVRHHCDAPEGWVVAPPAPLNGTNCVYPFTRLDNRVCGVNWKSTFTPPVLCVRVPCRSTLNAA